MLVNSPERFVVLFIVLVERFFFLFGVPYPQRHRIIGIVNFLMTFVVNPDNLFWIIFYVMLDQLKSSGGFPFPIHLWLSETYHAEFIGVGVFRQHFIPNYELVLFLINMI